MKQESHFLRDLPIKIRVSLGSAFAIGLLKGKIDVLPKTVYLLTYRNGKCFANCGFCPQARDSFCDKEMLSRVTWPVFSTNSVLKHIKETAGKGKIKRICIQALNYPGVFKCLQAIIKELHQLTKIAISISCQPLKKEDMQLLAEAGAERIGIPIDAATEELFEQVKGRFVGGPYSWERQLELLKHAVKIYGEGKVSTHLIVGLGETEEEMIKIIQKFVDMGVFPALFAFTPILGTKFEKQPQPLLASYRRIQLARYLICNKLLKFEEMKFSKGEIKNFGLNKQVLLRNMKKGDPFLTSGCPGCNRPFYNEKPSGPIYNYPRSLKEEEIIQIIRQLRILK
jgi:biotin synthase